MSNRYLHGIELGRGGMASVRRVTDIRLRRELAMKVMLRPDQPRLRRRFIEEAQIASQLQHPNIVPVYDLDEDEDGRLYLTMKRVVGETFGELIARTHKGAGPGGIGRSPELRKLLQVFIRACDGVAYAHSRGVIHRDLKPENVMVGEFGEVLVMDWGLARPFRNDCQGSSRAPVVTDARERDDDLTMPGTVLGTPAYMPPEQAQGLPHLDPRADVYALGGILYALLAGRPPYEGGRAQHVLRQVIEYQLERPQEAAPDDHIPAELDAIVMKAMARRVQNRFASVSDLRDEVERYLDGRSVQCANYSASQRVGRWVRHHPIQSATASAAVLMLAVCAAVVMTVTVTPRLSASEAQRGQETGRPLDEPTVASPVAVERNDGGLPPSTRREPLHVEPRQQQHAAESGHTDPESCDSPSAGAESGNTEPREACPSLSTAVAERFPLLKSLARLHRAAKSGEITGAEYNRRLAPALDDYLFVLDVAVGSFQASRLAPDPMVYYLRAILLEYTDRRAERIRDLEEVIRLRPARPDLLGGAYYRRSAFYFNAGQFDLAYRDAHEAVRYDKAPAVVAMRARCRAHRGEFATALEDCNAILESEPDCFEALEVRAGVRSKGSRLPEALDDYSRCIDLRPRDPWVWYRRGNCRVQARAYDGAMKDLETSLGLDPTFWPALALRGHVRAQLGDTDGARSDYHRALRMCDDPGHCKDLERRIRSLEQASGGY